MHVDVVFQDEQVGFDIPDDRLLGAWTGPPGLAVEHVRSAVRSALDAPLAYPPLRQAVVPGDRVVIPFDASIPGGSAILEAVCTVLREAGVENSSIHVLTANGVLEEDSAEALLRSGVTISAHNTEDRSSHAYLAATSQGRRVYLNRLVTDADFVLPIGRLGFDRALGYCGPWSVLYPGMSNTEAAVESAADATDAPPQANHDRKALTESVEVSWLLGTQFHVGVLDGVDGPAAVLAGRDAEVLAQAKRVVDAAWSFRIERPADLVIAGVGASNQAVGSDDLAQGLATAMRLVRRGGKIAMLSRASGSFGPATQRLIGLEDPRVGPSALRGSEGEPDYAVARQLARVLAWADVYLLSALDEDDVEGLGIVSLAKPTEARRLAAAAESVAVLSRAERTRGEVTCDEN